MLTTLALVGAAALAPDKHAFALRAAHVHVGDGTVLENAIVLIEDGKVVDVGKGLAFGKDVPLLEHDGHLSAGLVALRDYSGAGAEAADSTRAVMADADLAFAFNPDHSDMLRLVRAGVTTVVLMPRSGSNLVGGMPAVVKPGARVLAPRAGLHVDVSASGAERGRYPSSIAGQYEELERQLAQPKGVMAEVAAGRLPVMLEAASRHEVQHALAFATGHGLRGYLVDAPRAGELAESVRASGLGVALGPFGIGVDHKHLASAVSLAKAGVPLGFALDAPSNAPELLRWSAALCVRAGMERDVAFRALTSGGAALAGVGDRVGMVRAGMDADLVLWSGDPVDPASHVNAVYVDGELVHGTPEEDDEEDEE